MDIPIIELFVCLGALLLQFPSYVNAFKYKCFDGFCETKLNQFCNFRKEIQACSTCSQDVCEWDDIPQFCNETYCAGLVTSTTPLPDTTGTNHYDRFIPLLIGVAAFFSVYSLVSTTWYVVRGRFKHDECKECVQHRSQTFAKAAGRMEDGRQSEENGNDQSIEMKAPKPQPEANLDTGEHDKLLKVGNGSGWNNDTNHGRNAGSEPVMDTYDHRKHYKLLPSVPPTNYDVGMFVKCERQPPTKNKYPTEETCDSTAVKAPDFTDSGIDSALTSSNDTVNIDMMFS